ncbi:hypothetical protein ACLFMI_02930 [Pseudonocardia nantongensis]|uniref:hypothetical protein n=1 Tax=Pseudonocardia nantongensis TaxID=1181885 RepID=UPI00397E5A8F
MNRPRRVAVSAPPEPGARARPVSPRASPDGTLDPARTAAARAARRVQLRRATVTLTCGAVLLFGLPALLSLVPEPGAVRLSGLPLTWIAVALLPYPLLAGLAWWHLRRAERAERDAGPAPGAPEGGDAEPDGEGRAR